MSTLTPNMSLNVPIIGVDSGLTWEQQINANSSILDGHNHSVGSGVPVGPAGININADLPFGSNNATQLRSARFTAQDSPLSLAADLGCLYVSGVDLYYNDENGNQIQITTGGLVNATSSGISSGTASASFSASTLVVNAASNTPANVQCASVLLGNTGVSGSNYCTVSPPSSLAGNYSLTLPPIPAQTNVMTLTSAGVMSSITYDAVGQGMTSAGANAIAASVTRATGSSSEPVGGVAISAGSGIFSTASGTPVDIPNLAVTLVTSGRPVYVGLQTLLASNSYLQANSGGGAGTVQANFSLVRDGSVTLMTAKIQVGPIVDIEIPPSTLSYIDYTVTAGSHSYKAQVSAPNGGFAATNGVVLVAYEL